MPRFPSAQGRLNHEPDSTLAVTKTCPKDGVHLCSPGIDPGRGDIVETGLRERAAHWFCWSSIRPTQENKACSPEEEAP